ncbi:MAG: tetratricopeptide repeat protein [Prolixibacteraceae bacterium]|jgi:tetratricopeptide (TPR) repeat protein|nr:tetratricopeptide repeat protein [Prolixibacteraceae bacterium]
MAKRLIISFSVVACLIICGSLVFGYKTEPVKSQDNIWNPDSLTVIGKKLSVADIKIIIDSFKIYDHVRTKNQKEEYLRHLIAESKRQAFNWGEANAKNILGVLMRDRAEYAVAAELHESALSLAGSDTLIQIYALNNLGVVFRRLDKPRIALDYHMQALHLSEAFKGNYEVATRSACIALNSIGNINLALKQPQQALEVFNQTLEIEKKIDNHLGMAINYHNIGYAYDAMGKTETAQNYYLMSLEQNKIIDSDVGKAICYNSIGEVYLKQGSSSKALREFERAMSFARLSKDNYYISQSYANMGKAFIAQGYYGKAYEAFNEYNELAIKIKSGLLVQESYKLLSDYYEKTGQFEKAFNYYKIGVATNDSIVNEQNTRYLNELQTLYDADKKERQIDLLTIENQVKTQQNYIIIFVAIIVLLTLIVIYVVTQVKAEKQRTELRSSLFRSMMNPHFIFNALGSIQSFLYNNEPQKAAVYLGNFSKLTRLVLKNSNKSLITLEEELETLQHYLEIEQMRQRECFTYEINVNDDVELDFIYVLPTMLQPFVENSIQHGFKKTDCKKGLKITVTVTQSNNYLHIKLNDNGVGINSEKSTNDEQQKSMGLIIFKERIRLFEKKYKKTVNFVINDLSEVNENETGTLVSIDFPLIEPHD